MNIDLINSLISSFTKDTDIFPVEVKITPGKVLISIDKPEGITIEECVALSRFLYKELEESSIFEKHELEVGSPGMDQPLKVYRQYLRRIGRTIRVLSQSGNLHEGILIAATENEITLLETVLQREGKKKIKTEKNTVLSYSDIKETRLELKFNK